MSTGCKSERYEQAGLLDAAMITTETMVWADGQDEWSSLQTHETLYSLVYQISASGASALPATPADIPGENYCGLFYPAGCTSEMKIMVFNAS